MNYQKTALILAAVLGLLACGYVWAEAEAAVQAYASLPFCTLSADGKHLARQPCRTAPAQRPMPRRPVPQIVEPMPSPAAPPRVAMPPLLPSAALRAPSPPQPLGNCGAGGCYDAGGAWQGNGVGNTTVAPNGKLCQRNGIWLQCF
ncbi:MAG: hypothetical protein V4462_10280 [Pseudomonadota bacterium]